MSRQSTKSNIVKKLKLNETRYRELFDSINICVAVYKVKADGDDFVVKDLNTAAEKLEGVKRHDVNGQSILKVFPGFKDFGLPLILQRVWKTGVPERFPPRLYKDKRVKGWRSGYVYSIPPGDIVVVYEDITDRVKMNAVLREAELRYRTVADFTYDWEFWQGTDGKLIYVSPSCERISGYKPDEFLRNPLLAEQLIVPEDRQIMAAHKQKIRLNIVDTCTVRVRHKDGKIRWIENVCSPVRDDNGNFLGIRGTNRDVTERVLLEAEASRAKCFSDSIIDSLPGLFYVIRENGSFLRTNKNVSEVTGYSAEEILQLGVIDLISPEDRELVAGRMATVFADGFADVEARIMTRDGRKIPYHFTASRALIGDQVYLLGTGIDMTDHKRVEQAKEKIEKNYRLLAENTTDVILILDMELKPLWVSPSIEKQLGYTIEELKNIPPDRHIAPEYLQEAMNVYATVMRAEQEGKEIAGEYEVEAEVYRKDGSILWVENRYQLIRDQQGKATAILVQSRDVTGRKQAEKTLLEEKLFADALIESIQGTFYVIDENARYIRWNKYQEQITGYSKDDIRNINPLETIISEDREKVTNRILEVFSKGACDIETAVLTKDGEKIPFFLSFAPAVIQDKKYMVGIGLDISERKRVEQAQREAEKSYRLLAENTTDVVIIMDMALNITWVSPSATKMTGFSSEEEMNLPLDKRMSPGSAKRSMDLFTRFLLKEGEGSLPRDGHIDIELEICRKDGSTILTENRVKFIRDEHGKATAILLQGRDITDRQRAEKAREETEKVYKLLADNMTDSVWLMNLELLPVYISPSNSRLRGYSNEELLSLPLENNLTPESLAIAKETFSEAKKQVEQGPKDLPINRTLELEFCRKDGSAFWAECHFTLIRDENGEPQSILSQGRDITESKKAKEDLASSESRFRNLLDQAEEGIVIIQDERLKFINRKAAEIAGYGREELIEMNFLELFSGPDIAATKQYHEKIVAGDDVTHRLESRFIDGRGRVHWISLSGMATEWGNQPAFMYYVQDISESRKAAERLRASEWRFNEFFKHATNYCYLISAEGNILDLNKSALDVLGYSSKAEVIGKPALTTIFPAQSRERAKMLLIRWAETGVLENEEIAIAGKTGEQLEVMLSASAVRDDDGHLLHSILIQTDVTEHKRLLEEQTRLAKLTSVGTLAGGIAHDFNNILGAVLGNISLAMREIPHSNVGLDLLHEAENALLRATDLTRQLLTFTKGGAPVKKPATLKRLVREVATFAVSGSNTRCEFFFADDLWPADIDEGQISQVISNMVINAAQAMPAGGLIQFKTENITLSSNLSASRAVPLPDGNYVSITVKDNGTGIPAENINRIFDPYYTTKPDGIGLGLATCYSIIKQHGGHISVASIPGRGTKFYIYLPACPGAITHDPGSSAGKTCLFNGRVLVLDDEAALRQMTANMLLHLGFEHVDTASTGQETVEMYNDAFKSGQPFDLVILDLTIPGGMGGKETFEKLREIDPGVIAIISSGYANEPIMAEYGKHGFKGVISKPYTLEQFKNTLSMVLHVSPT